MYVIFNECWLDKFCLDVNFICRCKNYIVNRSLIFEKMDI